MGLYLALIVSSYVRSKRNHRSLTGSLAFFSCLGKLHAFSSRTYAVIDWTSGRRLTEPYGWNSEVTASAGRRQRFLSQNLFVDGLTVSSDPARGIISLIANTAIAKISGAICPEGFEIVEAHMDGRKQILGSVNLDYCRGTLLRTST